MLQLIFCINFTNSGIPNSSIYFVFQVYTANPVLQPVEFFMVAGGGGAGYDAGIYIYIYNNKFISLVLFPGCAFLANRYISLAGGGGGGGVINGRYMLMQDGTLSSLHLLVT